MVDDNKELWDVDGITSEIDNICYSQKGIVLIITASPGHHNGRRKNLEVRLNFGNNAGLAKQLLDKADGTMRLIDIAQAELQRLKEEQAIVMKTLAADQEADYEDMLNKVLKDCGLERSDLTSSYQKYHQYY